jgi:AcrR family transcriptional regulator
MSPVRNRRQPATPGLDPATRIEPQRPRRADARRNYESLLAAASEVFREQGVDAPLDEIARRAQVGNATMYRHFPTRQELIVAVYADEVSALCNRGTQQLNNDSPGDALFEWLEAFIAHVASKRFLTVALTTERTQQPPPLFDRWHQAMHDTAAALLQRAQHAGAIRPGIGAWDLLVLANGIALAARDTDQARRLLTTVRHGLDDQPDPGRARQQHDIPSRQ